MKIIIIVCCILIGLPNFLAASPVNLENIGVENSAKEENDDLEAAETAYASHENYGYGGRRGSHEHYGYGYGGYSGHGHGRPRHHHDSSSSEEYIPYNRGYGGGYGGGILGALLG